MIPPSPTLPEHLASVFPADPVSLSRCGGGDAADAYRVHLSDGTSVFMKTARKGSPFHMEAQGLKLMTGVRNGVRVPEVLHVEDHCLILEYIEFSSQGPGFQAIFGRQLAETHRQTHSAFGFPQNHAIGLSPQQNQPWIPVGPAAWRAFWWTHRLEPMIHALPSPDLQKYAFRLEKQLERWIPEDAGPPSLLHGDLWSGNTAADHNGQPVMFDPAPYYGYREAELGMTRMFGGFSDEFYQAYHEAWPLPEGWRDRMKFYMLYHVFNHAVLFQGSYLHQAKRLIDELL